MYKTDSIQKNIKFIDVIKELDNQNILEITNELMVIKNKIEGLGFEFNHILRVIIYVNNTLEIELIEDNSYIYDDDVEEDSDYSNELEYQLNKDINKVIDILSFIRDNKQELIKRILDLVLEK